VGQPRKSFQKRWSERRIKIVTEDLTLAGLIDLAFERHEVRSGAELERVAQGLGYKIVATTINHIRANTYKPKPRKATLEAIAKLAGVPVSVAYDAAGLPAPGPPFAEQLPDGVDYLSPNERDVVIRLLRLLVERHALGDEGAYSQVFSVRDVGGVSELARASLPRTGRTGEGPSRSH
jgi:hypothetical protein